MSDMLDVMHFYMEEDFSRSSTAEQSEAKDKARELIYSSLYNQKYTLARKNKDYQTANSSGEFYEDEIVPVDPLKEPTKSYFPSTDFNPESPKPFGDLLDAPIGNQFLLALEVMACGSSWQCRDNCQSHHRWC